MAFQKMTPEGEKKWLITFCTNRVSNAQNRIITFENRLRKLTTERANADEITYAKSDLESAKKWLNTTIKLYNRDLSKYKLTY